MTRPEPSGTPSGSGCNVVDWWVWIVLVLVVMVVLVGGFVAVQARRRSGGVVTEGRAARKGPSA